ncbi:hypothetical protein V7127_03305 [Bacillus sp. JJ1773]|uniref:hypothetical protein n=2 Tax=unclassified Bacillus (in: firmicutes) TaxID=185979 RepID=UPI002FFE1204
MPILGIKYDGQDVLVGRMPQDVAFMSAISATTPLSSPFQGSPIGEFSLTEQNDITFHSVPIYKNELKLTSIYTLLS